MRHTYLTEIQRRCNAESAGAWELYRPHRDRVTGLLLAAKVPGPGRLCLLGAGNLNDGARFDVVASVGLLTQLVDSVASAVGETHPRFWELVRAVRSQHVRLLVRLARAGGAAVLVTEMVSSDTCPALPSTPASGLPPLLHRCIEGRNFFTGTNPVALGQLLRADEHLAARLARVRFAAPWLWPTPARTYAAYAITMWRATAGQRDVRIAG